MAKHWKYCPIDWEIQ